jgi:flavin reductase (DIM6/NTAB) family NADH-FMN oxidoreductase RutF
MIVFVRQCKIPDLLDFFIVWRLVFMTQPRVDSEDLRLVMRQWATGVTVVSVQNGAARHGMTVSSFTSVSLAPPLVLVSLERVARTCGLVEKAGCFGVTILSMTQREISDRFAGRIADDQDRFDGVETFTLVSGAPLIVGGLAYFDCQVVATYPAGTHTVFIAEVMAVQQNPGEPPLMYYDRDYRGIVSG